MQTMTSPVSIPGAIDVSDDLPVHGKMWSGGSANRPKLVIHTIEGADYRELGWQRDWTQWKFPPHVVINAARYPDKDWLIQTIPFNLAAYSIRHNDTELMKYVYQIEVAGMAADVPEYPDEWYIALAEVCDFFVDSMGVPDNWLDFSCAEYGKYTSCRLSQSDVDKFSGFLGHAHVGRGVDTHSDPGKLDVQRLRSFMGGNTPPPTKPPSGGTVYLPLVKTDGYNSNPDRREDVKWLQTALLRAGYEPGTVDGKYGYGTSAAVASLAVGGNGEVFGFIEYDKLLFEAYNGDDMSNPDPRYALANHSHDIVGTTV